MAAMDGKQCEICKQVKAESEFYPKRSFHLNRDSNTCKACIAARSEKRAKRKINPKANENWINRTLYDIDGSDY